MRSSRGSFTDLQSKFPRGRTFSTNQVTRQHELTFETSQPASQPASQSINQSISIYLSVQVPTYRLNSPIGTSSGVPQPKMQKICLQLLNYLTHSIPWKKVLGRWGVRWCTGRWCTGHGRVRDCESMGGKIYIHTYEAVRLW